MNRKRWSKDKKQVFVEKEKMDAYEHKMGYYARTIDQKVVSSFLDNEKGFILDLGCGTGRFTSFLESSGARVIGADYSPGMLHVAQKRIKSPLVRCDAFNLPFKDNVFDNVLSMRLIFHYYRPRGIVEEVKRVMDDTGAFVFDSLNKYSLRYFLYFIQRVFQRRAGRQMWYASKKEMLDFITSIGLGIEKSESRYLLPTRFYRFLPHVLIFIIDKIEPFWPAPLRQISYWKTRCK